MTDLSLSDTKKRRTATPVATPTLALQRGFDPRARTDGEQSAISGQHSVGAVHDFGGVGLQSEVVSEKTGQPCQLATPRTCPFGGACHTCPARVQAKLVVGQPDDECEREADEIAERIMRMPESGDHSSFVVPRSSLSRTPSGAAGDEVMPEAGARIQSPCGGGRPLSESERAFFEPRFGHDFSGVRIHDDARAAVAARATHSRAFTVGSDVVFGAGRHAPDTQEGRNLLAHELAHVVQQNRTTASKRLQRSPEVFGDAVQFEVIPQCPPAARVLGSFPDEDIAAELYGDPSYPVTWSLYDAEAIDVDMDALREEWRPYFADSVCEDEAAGGVNWSSVSEDQRILHVMGLLVFVYGYPMNGAAGLVGNLMAESGVLPDRVEGSGAQTPLRARDFRSRVTDFTAEEVMNRSTTTRQGPRRPGVGLAQWTTSSRRAGLFQHEFGGRQLGAAILFNMDAQVDYLVTELQAQYARVNAIISAADVSVEDASDEVVYRFEVPGSVLSAGSLLPRSDPRVQSVFATRRGNAQRALRVFEGAQPGQ